MASENCEPLIGEDLNATITRQVVKARRRYMGRGPTTARSFYRHNVIVVMMQGLMTGAETSLVAHGKAEAVLEMRDRLRGVMDSALVPAIENLTGRQVVASMGADHIEPDMAAALFVLDRPLRPEPAVTLSAAADADSDRGAALAR